MLDVYGVSKMMFELAGALRDKGYTVIFSSDNQDSFKSYVEKMGFGHYRLPLRPDRKGIINFLVCFVKILQIVKKERINIIHSHHRWSSFICFLISKMLRVPLVTTYHGIHQGNKLLTLWGDKIISVSEDAKQHLIHYFKIDPKKIKVINNGIRIPRLEEIGISPEKNCNLNPLNPPTIANISRMSPEKDQESLFLAMKMVLDDHPDARLVMVGKGPLENNLKKLAVELDMEKNIEFVGEVENISDILAKIDMVVLTSLTEGLPISILEALSFGVPVVATSVGDIPKVIMDKKTGCLVPPKDPERLAEAINFMIDNSDAAHKMGLRGRKMVSDKFSAEQMVIRTEKVYLELLSSYQLSK